MILKDWMKVYKQVEQKYLDHAEGDGQEGDMESYDHLMEIAAKLKTVCEKVDAEYNLHQSVNTLQFANLLVTLGVYKEIIPCIIAIVREKESEIKQLQEECDRLKELTTIRTSVSGEDGKFQEVLYGGSDAE